MNSLKLILIPVLLFLLSFPCEHLCETYQASIISSLNRKVPQYCWNNFETIRCYEVCNDHESFTPIINRPKHRRGESLYIAAAIIEIEGEKRLEELKHLAPSPVTDPFGVISQPGFQYPCEYKCESDPLYWTCIAECYERDPTALWDSQCYKTNLCNTSAPNHLLRGRCLPCLTQSTLDQLQKTCEIAYLPNSAPGINNLCIEMERCINKVPTPGSPGGGVNRTIRECAMDPQVQNRKELMQLCVTDTIMSAQRDCCYSEPVREASLCKTNNHKCDEFCDRILSPRLCQATCKKIRDKDQHECLENTCTFNYPISKIPCVHCMDSSLLTLKTHVEACTFPFCIRNLTTTKETYLTDNCHNLDWIQRFASFLKTKLNINNDIWTKVEVDKMDWITSHFTPIECFNDSMTDPLKGCAAEFLTAKRDSAVILAKCESNPYRILDMLICGLHQEESLSWMNVLNQRNKFTEIRCKNEKLTLEVYKLVFQYEEKVCDDYCAKSKIRPENVASMKCRLEQCLVKEENLKIEHRKHCKPLEDAYLVQVSDFAPCRWQVDFAKSSNPYVLYATYFNELGPSEIRDKLEHPDTTGILQETDVNGKEGFYTFPYFVVVRSLCDDNGYYDDGAYRFFVVGGNPIVELKYTAPTSRHSPTTLIHGVFQSSLVKLNSKGNDELIPLNPGSVDEEGNGCHEKICHPGFVVPLILLNIPHFEVQVKSQEAFSNFQETMYVSAFHSRAVEGKGEIQIATSDYPAHAGMLFPKKRSSIFTDIELSFHSSCFANDLSDSTSEGYKKLKCSELDHILDEFDHPYETNIFAPLDAEDMLRSQYTYDTAPVQAIAGFYDPRFLVIGDPDMNDFEVVNWGKLLKPLEKDTSLHSCIQQDLVHKGYPKPIYSQIDRTDPDYPIKYYRQRYAGRVYYDEKANKKSKEEDLPETAVFEAIALEDRLLLVTTKGLVSVYGHTNATVATNRQWTFSTDPARQDQIDRCFKLVRVLRRAQPNSDTIVGITYDYKVRNPTTKELEEVTQQVWVGKFTYPGQNIEWSKVEAVSVDNNIESHRVLDGAEAMSPGDPVLFDPVKQPGLPLQIREANPKSPIETICYKTYRTVIQPVAPRATVYDDRGWCQVIDATPEVMKELTIQVLVRFRLMYNEEGRDIIPVYFYILATHTLKQNSSVGFWRIDAVIPRKPCLDQHHESIKNTFLFDKTYFIHKTVGTGQEYGCYDDGNRKEKYIDSYVYLTGMTYTRTLTNHLFLYGSRLLHSTDNGKTFVFHKGFPRRYHDMARAAPSTVEVFHREVHRIMLMAFNDKGHYAFLTNKLELWVGNTGSLELILLRPSPLRGMVQLGLSKVRNLHDGVPFSIHFDSSDSLYEMVAIVGKEGHVTRIMKRPATEWKLLRVRKMFRKFKEKSELLVQQRAKDKAAGLSKELQMSFNYDSSMWANTCPFSSPKLSQNFSSTNSRTQGMYFPNPRQHLKLGKAYIEASLMTFQAATFSLVWKSFYNVPIRYYTGKDKDAFELWIDKKRDMAILGVLQFGQGEPEDTGIVVQPRKFKRLQSYGNSSNLENSYYIDYNQVAELRLEFSSKNDFMVLNTDYEAQEINAIQLNVENANGSIIQVNTDKVFEAHRAVVVFFVRISVKRKTGLSQNLPGEHLLPVPMTFHFIGAFGNCIKNRANGIIGDSVETVAYVGCPPSRDFVFNWKSTLKSLKFRSGDTNHGTGDMCHGHEFACFFSRNPLVLFFDIFDESKQKFIPYTGKYTLRIIAGGRTKDEMRMFTDEEIQGYNVPGISDVSLIWNEWDITRHQKVERKPQTLYDDDGQEVHRDSREVILESGKSTILWACHTLSPCARVRPTWNLEVIFWFRLQITNRDVDNDTLCLYEKEIDIMLYGFNPSPEFQLFSTLGFCFFLLTILYICYRCCRRHQYLWRATKVNVRSWIRITKEVFPKKIRKYEPPLPEEVLERRQKVHRGFGSQDITHGDDDSNASLVDADSQEGGNKAHSSASSVGSLSTSMADSSQILPDNRPQYLPLSAKGVVYDQILTRRLNSIVERNRAMRQNLIRKASIQLKVDDLETEAHFEAQFGRTVSQESVFTPPMPKDRKRGVDNFFF